MADKISGQKLYTSEDAIIYKQGKEKYLVVMTNGDQHEQETFHAAYEKLQNVRKV